MGKLLTLELDLERETIELHLNMLGAEYLRNVLTELIINNTNCDHQFMSPDWGGSELSSEKQNLSTNIQLLHQLKIMYWEE